MLDLNQALAALLEPIARVELEFPDTSAEFPVITIAEVANITNYAVENKEHISDITYQVDVWDNGSNRQRCELLALEVSRVLTGAGFVRTLGRGFKDESGLHRKMMYFQTKAVNQE